MWPFNKKKKKKKDPLDYFQRLPYDIQQAFKFMQEELHENLRYQQDIIKNLNDRVEELTREVARTRVRESRNKEVEKFFDKFVPEEGTSKKAQWQQGQSTQAINRTARQQRHAQIHTHPMTYEEYKKIKGYNERSRDSKDI